MQKIKLAAVGDIMLGDHPVCFGHGVRSKIREKGFSYLLREVKPILSGHELFFGNLECVLSDIGHDESKLSSSEMRGDPCVVNELNFCQENILSLANNHALQHGSAAFLETADLLRQRGIRPIGLLDSAGSNVVAIDRDGVKMAFIAYSLRPEHYCQNNIYYAQAKIDDVIAKIRTVKSAEPSRLIIVSLHWGEEYLHEPSSEQIDWAHKLIDSGASVILGHHPHALQGVEQYKNGLIAYSLGNFLFDSWQKPTRETAILSCTLSEAGVDSFELIPAYIGDDYSLLINEKMSKEISEKLKRYHSAVIERSGLSSMSQEEYGKVAGNKYFRYRIECYVYFLMNIWRYSPSVIYDSLFRAFLRRLGFA